MDEAERPWFLDLATEGRLPVDEYVPSSDAGWRAKRADLAARARDHWRGTLDEHGIDVDRVPVLDGVVEVVVDELLEADSWFLIADPLALAELLLGVRMRQVYGPAADSLGMGV